VGFLKRIFCGPSNGLGWNSWSDDDKLLQVEAAMDRFFESSTLTAISER